MKPVPLKPPEGYCFQCGRVELVQANNVSKPACSVDGPLALGSRLR